MFNFLPYGSFFHLRLEKKGEGNPLLILHVRVVFGINYVKLKLKNLTLRRVKDGSNEIG